MSEKIKCYEITPAGGPDYDSIIVRAGDSWKPALEYVEQSLEDQFLAASAEPYGPDWDDIKVEINCVYKTAEELEEIEP